MTIYGHVLWHAFRFIAEFIVTSRAKNWSKICQRGQVYKGPCLVKFIAAILSILFAKKVFVKNESW